MSHPFFVFNRKELFFLITVFVLGLITGASLLNLYLAPEIDSLILKNKELENLSQEQKQQIENLEKNLARQKQHFIQTISVTLKTDLNQHTQQEIVKEIKNLLSRFPGQELTEIDPLTVRDILDDRILDLENKTYHLHFIYLIFKEEMEVGIRVESSNLSKNKEQ